MGEEIPALFILGWTPRGLATAAATALLGPRLDSPTFWRRTSSVLPAFGAVPACTGAYSSSSSSIRSGGRLRHLIFGRPGRSQTPYFHINKSPLLGKEGPSSPHFDQCQAWNWGPQGWPTASPRRRVGRLIRFGVNFSNLFRRGGDGGKANCRKYRRRRSSLASISPLNRSLKRQKLDTRSGRR